MERCVWLGLLALCSTLAAGAVEDRFSGTLRHEDFAGAGLAKLSPQELARLDALVGEFKREVETRAAQAENEARAARAAAEQQKAEATRLAQLKKKLSPRVAVELEPIETRIKGKFTGWQGKTVFYLEDGTRWQIANADESYYTPAIDNPRVKIEPASFGGFWMTIVDIDRRVRVSSLGTR